MPVPDKYTSDELYNLRWRYYLKNAHMGVLGFTRQAHGLLVYLIEAIHYHISLSKKWARRISRRLTRYSFLRAKRNGRKLATSVDVIRAFLWRVYTPAFQRAIQPYPSCFRN